MKFSWQGWFLLPLDVFFNHIYFEEPTLNKFANNDDNNNLNLREN